MSAKSHRKGINGERFRSVMKNNGGGASTKLMRDRALFEKQVYIIGNGASAGFNFNSTELTTDASAFCCARLSKSKLAAQSSTGERSIRSSLQLSANRSRTPEAQLESAVRQ
jgi:hypothetical protein